MTARLCACGAEVAAADDRCAACGARTPVRRRRGGLRLPRVKRRVLIGAVAALLVPPCVLAVADFVRDRRARTTSPWRAHDEAVRRKKAGDARGARDVLVEATKRDTPDSKAWLSLAMLDREQGLAPETVVAEARRAAEIDPAFSDAWLFLAGEELRAGRMEAAAAAAETACRDAKPKSGARRFFGELLLRKRPAEPARAIEVLRRAREDDGDDPHAALLLAEACLREYGEPPAGERPPEMQSALADAARVLESEAAHIAGRAQISAAWVAVAIGRPEQAVAAADAALRAIPKELEPVAAEMRAVRGRALLALGRPAEAVASLAAALGESPSRQTVSSVVDFLFLADADDLWDRTAEATRMAGDASGTLHFGRASLRLAQGRFDEAAADADAAVRAAPSEPAFRVLAGDVRRALRDRDGAAAAYAEASKLDPTDATPLVRRALVVADARCGGPPVEGDVEAASNDVAARAAAATGDVGALHAALGALRLAAGRRDDARTELAAAQDAARCRADAWLLVGDAWATSPLVEDQERAAQAYGRARQLRPLDSQLAVREAAALLGAGDLAGAQALLDAVLARRSDSSALALRALALGGLRRWADAAADLAKLAERAPSDDAVFLRRVEALYRAGDVPGARAAASARAGTASPEIRARLVALRRALDPESPATSGDVVAPLVEAEVRLREGDAAGCARIARARLMEDPRDDAAVVLLALAVSGDGAAAAQEIRAAAARTPSAGARAALVDACAKRAAGDLKAAARGFASVLPSCPDDPTVRRLLADSLTAAGDAAGGLRELRAAAALASAPDSLRAEVAETLRAGARGTSDPAAAERLLREARAASPASWQATDDLCVTLLRSGRAALAAAEAEDGLRVARADDGGATRLRYRAAQARLAAGEPERAAEHLAALPPDEATSAQAATLRGVVHLRAGRFAEAAAELERAWRADADDEIAFVAYVEALLSGGRIDDAKTAVAERRRARGDDRRAAAGLALAFARHGLVEDGRGLARAAADSDPGDVALARLAASLTARAGAAAEAVAVARRCAASASDVSRRRARLLLGEALEQYAAAHDEARTAAESVLADAAATPRERIAAKVFVAECRLGQGDAYSAGQAASAVIADLAASAADAEAASLQARCRFVVGSAAHLRKDDKTAETELAGCLALDPDHAAAANNLAWLLMAKPENAKRAADLARRATSLAPSNPDFWDTRGVCVAALGDTKDAEECLRRAIDGYAKQGVPGAPRRAGTMLRLASMLAQIDRGDEARSLAREVADMDVPSGLQREARRAAGVR